MDSDNLTGGYGYPVESYHEFLNSMEQTDYSDNQIVVDSSANMSTGTDSRPNKNPRPNRKSDFMAPKLIRTKSRSINDLKSSDPVVYFPNSYPPTGAPKLWHDQILSNDRADSSESLTGSPDKMETQPRISPTSSHSSGKYNEFININDFNIQLDLTHQYDLSMDDNLSILSYDDDEDEENYKLQQQFLNSTNDTTNDSTDFTNPLVPGLFPKMDINDEDNFLKFDKLPLNPSYIVNSDDSS